MSNETKHTPTPWRLNERSENLIGANGARVVLWNSGFSFGNRTEETEANSKFIVRACNAHEDLLAALQRIANSEPRPKRNGDFDAADIEDLQRIARKAIAKAEGRA